MPKTSLRIMIHLAMSLLLLGLIVSGCEQGVREETLLFQEAEALYRAGDYDGASQRYDAFLEAYPRSPLSRTAKLRQRTIDREMESVMGTRGTNRPIYIRPTAVETAEIIKSEVQQPEDEATPKADDTPTPGDDAPKNAAPAPPKGAPDLKGAWGKPGIGEQPKP